MSSRERGSNVLSFRNQFYSCSCILVTPIFSALLHVKQLDNVRVYDDALGKYRIHAEFGACALGIFVAALAMYYIGRKKVIVLTNLCFFTLLLLLDTEISPKIDYVTVLGWIVARLLLYVSTLVFVVEMVHPKWRALFISVSFVAECLGYILGYFLPPVQRARWTVGLMMTTAAVILSLRASETPYWLAVKGRQEEAKQAFQEARGEAVDEAELEEMLSAAAVDSGKRSRGLARNVISKQFFTPWIIIGFVILGTTYVCAFNTSLSTTLMKMYGKNINFDSNLNNFLFERISSLVAAIIFCILSCFLRRRTLYLVSITLHIVSLLTNILAPFGHSAFVYMSLLCSAIEQLGSQPIRVLLFAEIFPAVVREFGVAFSVFVEELIRFTQDFIDFTNIHIIEDKAIIIIRISYCFIPVGIIFSYLFIPETKDLTLVKTEKLAQNWNNVLRGKYDTGQPIKDS